MSADRSGSSRPTGWEPALVEGWNEGWWDLDRFKDRHDRTQDVPGEATIRRGDPDAIPLKRRAF